MAANTNVLSRYEFLPHFYAQSVARSSPMLALSLELLRLRLGERSGHITQESSHERARLSAAGERVYGHHFISLYV